jgi:protoporphyrin/coproporphyrin ferrochelatase
MSAYDAFLLLSFGGPEGPDDVLPFLENVTRGRGIPAERLAEVAEHYYAVGGASPINAQCRELLAAIAAAGLDLPMYWGNRNWQPFLTDTVAKLADDGAERVIAFATSAYSSYSACRQYLDDIDLAVAAVGPRAPRIDKIRPYFNHPGFIEPFAASVADALATLPGGASGGAREAARLIAERTRGGSLPFDLVYQSRSGPPSVPWLEPDVNDHLAALAKEGAAAAVVVVPVGFVSDHMEVVHDLDTEAARASDSLGLPFARAKAPGATPRFASMVCELVAERATGAPALALGDFGLGAFAGSAFAGSAFDSAADGCPADCCRYTPGRPARQRAENTP